MKHIGENENKISKILIFSVNFPGMNNPSIVVLGCKHLYWRQALFTGVVESHGPGSSILDLSINGTLAIQQPKKMTTPHQTDIYNIY